MSALAGFVRGILTRARLKKHLVHKHHTKSSKRGEPRKVVVSESLATAARRCLIHLLPIFTSIAILVVNIHGVYIGVDFSGPLKSDTIHLMFLQLAAKAHEIMIVASLSVILLHTVRHELLFGDGLPLGLIGSGLVFNHFEFFFKREFYGSLKYLALHGKKARKFGFVALLVVSGLTAVLAGPASAVLLVPKSQTYPCGGTDFFLNGSKHDFWPETLAGDISELQHYCSSKNSTSLGVCPGGGFFSLWNRWSVVNYTNFMRKNVPSYAKDLAGSHFYWPIGSPASQIPPLYTLGDARPDNQTLQPHTWLVQAHAASAVMLQHITAHWWESLPFRMSIDPIRIDDRNIKASVPSIISSVRCADPQIVSALDKIVQFPTIEGRWYWAKNVQIAVDTLNTTAADHLRFHWAHLPDEFGASSIGGIFETPWVSENSTRLVIGCSAQTGWVPTDVLTDSYTFWSGWYPYNIQFGSRTPSWTPVAEGEPLPPTNGRIALGDEWLKLLTPLAPAIGFQSNWWQASTIESILTSAGLADVTSSWDGNTLMGDWLNGDALPEGGKTRLLEAVICSILADGLSRSGSHRVFNTTGPSPGWSLAMYNPREDFAGRIWEGKMAFEGPNDPSVVLTTLHASMQITGFVYKVTLASYLSMAVLLTHILMALTHIIRVICHKRTSRSWNSIAELISLSQNSRPAFDALTNTGAGIHCSETFARVAKIRLRPQPGSPNLDHIELVFEDSAGGTDAVVLENPANSVAVRLTSMLDSLGTAHKARGSWTFPLNFDERHLPMDVELGSQSSARERLIPKVHLPNGEKGDMICVNHAYG